ncbi:MAG: hypothetical protein ACMUHY_02980 [Thermoplasmatota archaeon]
MRLRIFSAGTVCLMLGILLLASVPIPSEAVSYDPYDIYPGPDPRWFELQDFDRRGDRLDLTIVFKKTENGSFQERPISIAIMDTTTAKRNPPIDRARSEAIFIRENVVTRLELVGGDSIVNTRNTGMSMLFYNEIQDGDLVNWEESAVRIRVDYTVINKTEEKSNLLLILILVLLLILILGGLVGLGYFLLKRRVRDSRTFFNPEGHLYYVFKDIDGSVFYFTEEQYAHMYNQNALVTYEYMGQAMKKGGPVMIPVEEQGMYEEGLGPVFSQPETPVPLDAQQMPRPSISQPGPEGSYQGGSEEEARTMYDQDLYTQVDPYSEEPSREDVAPPSPREGEEPPAEGSDSVLDELVSQASTLQEEATDESMIMRLDQSGISETDEE